MQAYALNIEDLTVQSSFQMFSLKNVKLTTEDPSPDQYCFPVETAKLPPNFKEMELCLVPMENYRDDQINHKDECIFVKIKQLEGEKIHFEVKFSSREEVQEKYSKQRKNLGKLLHVRFIPNRITYRSCLQALDVIKSRGLSDYFEHYETSPANCKETKCEKFVNFEWFNKQVGNNQEQMTAIKSIVNCTAFPFPYVIFGPPGTGKTSCIVECVAQILNLKPNSRIIVTAQSNSACDEIGVRLLKHVSWNKVFRFYSPSMQINSDGYEIPQILRQTSNLRNKTSQFPTKEEFCHFKVVITTLMSCSRLVQFECQMNRHFDYIIVDECASALELESLIPIVGEFN
jgi:hypothetical protein